MVEDQCQRLGICTVCNWMPMIEKLVQVVGKNSNSWIWMPMIGKLVPVVGKGFK
jgi:hypothetical protein